jgi:hypothetical protein
MVNKHRKFPRMTLIIGFLAITLIGFGVFGVEKSSASTINFPD